MFYDLNVPWRPNEAGLEHTIAFLNECKSMGYNTVALSHIINGKLPADLSCAIPEKISFPLPTKVRILRRCTLILSDPSQNHRLNLLAGNYHILALRPTNEKSLQQACQSLDADLISIDLTTRLDYHFKMKPLSQAIERGIKFEICYSPALLSSDSNARKNLISNVTQLIRATRGRGLVISSEASSPLGCRAPHDLINLAAVWGLSPERGKEAIDKLARSVVVSAQMKRTSFRGVVDVIYGGEKPDVRVSQAKDQVQGLQKRKAESAEEQSTKSDEPSKGLSKREQKRRAKKARLEAHQPNALVTAEVESSNVVLDIV